MIFDRIAARQGHIKKDFKLEVHWKKNGTRIAFFVTSMDVRDAYEQEITRSELNNYRILFAYKNCDKPWLKKCFKEWLQALYDNDPKKQSEALQAAYTERERERDEFFKPIIGKLLNELDQN